MIGRLVVIRGHQELADVFKQLRLDAGLKGPELARLLCVHRSTLENREHGRHRWDVDSAVRAAEVFGSDLVLVRREKAS